MLSSAVKTLLTPETVMSAAPDRTRMYSVWVTCQWFWVVNSEPTWKVMMVGGKVEVSGEAEEGKAKVVEVGGGR